MTSSRRSGRLLLSRRESLAPRGSGALAGLGKEERGAYWRRRFVLVGSGVSPPTVERLRAAQTSSLATRLELLP
jgi:hypothetical protein